MRVACIYLPSFPLQAHVRQNPGLAGASVAITDAVERPTIIAYSRLAWESGIRHGMTASGARALAPELILIPGDIELYTRTTQSLGESLLNHSVTVDIGKAESALARHKSLYLHVPSGTRGESFGNALLAHLDAQGFCGRIGVADDRFTAWAAAVVPPPEKRKNGSQLELGSHSLHNPGFVQSTTSVPRGGAASFLAPLPLELLPLPEEIQQMLHTLGIHTLGDFAALPPPSVGRRWSKDGVNYQALARGYGSASLTRFVPTEDISESIDSMEEIAELEPLSFLLRPLIDRACERLRGRGMAAAELTLDLKGSDGETSITIAPSSPTLSSHPLSDLLRAKLSEKPLEHPVETLILRVTRESDPEVQELDLFDHRDARTSADAVDVAIARLQATLGEDNVSSANIVSTHRPERAFKLTPFSPPKKRKQPRRAVKKQRATAPRSRRSSKELILPMVLTGMVGALRLVEPPRAQPAGLHAINYGGEHHRVVASHGPTRIDSDWWTEDHLERDYYQVETDDGGRYWVFRAKDDDRYYLHGIFD